MSTTPIIVFVVIAFAAVLVLGGGILICIRFKANQARIRSGRRELGTEMEQGQSRIGSRGKEIAVPGYETTWR